MGDFEIVREKSNLKWSEHSPMRDTIFYHVWLFLISNRKKGKGWLRMSFHIHRLMSVPWWRFLNTVKWGKHKIYRKLCRFSKNEDHKPLSFFLVFFSNLNITSMITWLLYIKSLFLLRIVPPPSERERLWEFSKRILD